MALRCKGIIGKAKERKGVEQGDREGGNSYVIPPKSSVMCKNKTSP